MANYLIQLIVAIDQLFNALTGGWADETFSSRCYRLRAQKRFNVCMVVIDWVAKTIFRQQGHCLQEYRNEWRGLHVAPEFRRDSELKTPTRL